MNARCDVAGASRAVHAIVPDAIDDPLRPSGGNSYDRRVCDGLARSGRRVIEHAVPDAWPRLGSTGRIAVEQLVSQLPDGALVLVDGLIAANCASALVPAAHRLSLVVLVHAVPDGRSGAAAALSAAQRVVTTSAWLRDELLRNYRLPPDRLVVAVPGAAPSPLASRSRDGHRLLCVGVVAPHKGQDVLLAALAAVADRRWSCRCVGSLGVDPQFVSRLDDVGRRTGLRERVEFCGPRTGAALEHAFGSADVLVHPARDEAYGMVVTEALAHGLPVITTSAGGLLESLGTAPDGDRPGLVVPPGDTGALAHAISRWLADEDLRRRLRRAARERRDGLPTWCATVQRIDAVLGSVR